MKAVVDEAGRIQLPEEVRAQLGVKPGDDVVLEKRSGEWVLKADNAQTGLAWEGNVLVHKGASMTSATMGEIIDEIRDDRFGQLIEGLAQ